MTLQSVYSMAAVCSCIYCIMWQEPALIDRTRMPCLLPVERVFYSKLHIITSRVNGMVKYVLGSCAQFPWHPRKYTLSVVHYVMTVYITERRGGCGPVVRLLAFHARVRRSFPYWRESGVLKLISSRPYGHGINYTSCTVETWWSGRTATLTQW